MGKVPFDQNEWKKRRKASQKSYAKLYTAHRLDMLICNVLFCKFRVYFAAGFILPILAPKWLIHPNGNGRFRRPSLYKTASLYLGWWRHSSRAIRLEWLMFFFSFLFLSLLQFYADLIRSCRPDEDAICHLREIVHIVKRCTPRPNFPPLWGLWMSRMNEKPSEWGSAGSSKKLELFIWTGHFLLYTGNIYAWQISFFFGDSCFDPLDVIRLKWCIRIDVYLSMIYSFFSCL